jgi:tetratricopeptide (TPR) repeat protein
MQTFDGFAFRYGSQAEDHLKELIAADPQNGLLWSRLGNVYEKGRCPEEAQEAFARAVELNDLDVESHYSLGAYREQDGRLEEAAAHYRKVLMYARRTKHTDFTLLCHMVSYCLDGLLGIHHQTNGKLGRLPDAKECLTPEERAALLQSKQPLVVKLEQHDLSTEEGWRACCEMFVGKAIPRQMKLWESPDESDLPPLDLPEPGGNNPCPCGSGRKYEKCCGKNR